MRPADQPPDARARGSHDRTDLLRTSDVAALFQVSTRTVSEWARRGRLPCMRTPGGQWRYPAEPIHRLARTLERGEWDPEGPVFTANASSNGAPH
ncbi:MAG TPA: helix-turn-helix domain-containing protein [Acidimicrobiales bacterium]|jgi:excisionase family DNA binding protein|nr:helix-turn-helix domain-containing protein [Acidimicrobiales bacterium]